jgi:ZIP family zinc transporter
VPVAAVVGSYLARIVTGALPFMLAVGAGALLYLACNEIIPESHSHGNEKGATFGLLSGVVVIILVRVLVGG